LALKEYTNSINGSFKTYDKLIEQGVRKEDARFVLPEAAHTTLIVTGNFQAWRDFLNLRLDSAAQWEIRDVASQILVALNKEAPTVFPIDIVEKV
jgi:thymidylate synthase (FAD)